MTRLALSAAALAAGLSGCATPARYVERRNESGVVAVPTGTDAFPTYHRRAAVALIERHVGEGYEIVDEREVATGKTTHNDQRASERETLNPILDGTRQTVSNTTTTRDVTEWRISYRKRPPVAPLISDDRFEGAPPRTDPAGDAVRRTEYRSGSGGAGVKPAGGAGAPADCKQ